MTDPRYTYNLMGVRFSAPLHDAIRHSAKARRVTFSKVIQNALLEARVYGYEPAFDLEQIEADQIYPRDMRRTFTLPDAENDWVRRGASDHGVTIAQFIRVVMETTRVHWDVLTWPGVE